MLHHLSEVHAVHRIFPHNFSNKIFCLVANYVPTWRVEVVFAVLDHLEHFEVIFIVKRHSSRKNDKTDDANAPVITLFTVLLLFEYLRCDVAGRSAGSTSHIVNELFSVQEFTGQSEIGNLHRRQTHLFGSEKQVFWLDVAMQDPKFVAITNSIDQIAYAGARIRLRKLVSREDFVEQLASLHPLHDEAVVALVLI